MLLASPLLIACLALSYRRSFWIGAVLGPCCSWCVLGTSPVGRRLLVPAACWRRSRRSGCSDRSTSSRSCPLVKRVASLSPDKLEANVQDRYRLDERANVLRRDRRTPDHRPRHHDPVARRRASRCRIEHEEARQYVHFAALWFWLKLGILGLFAYVG